MQPLDVHVWHLRAKQACRDLGVILRRQNLEKLDGSALRARAATRSVRVCEGWTLRPAITVRFSLPACQHDVPTQLRRVLQDFQALEARHLVYLPCALCPTVLEARSRLGGNGDMKQRDDHRRSLF